MPGEAFSPSQRRARPSSLNSPSILPSTPHPGPGPGPGSDDPEHYADANHKPEMALALRDFEALCGFVTQPELCAALAAVRRS